MESSLSGHTKKTFQRKKKLQSDTNIDTLQNPVTRAASHIVCSLSLECQQPSATPESPPLSVHLLQETNVIRATLQFIPLYLTGLSCFRQCHRYPIKIKLGCRGMFGAIWQKTLGALRIFFDSDLPLQLPINTNTFQMATIKGLGCNRGKKK